jgi:hypothetical protein
MIDRICELRGIIQLKLQLLMRIFQFLFCSYKNKGLNAEAGNKNNCNFTCLFPHVFSALNHLSNARCTGWISSGAMGRNWQPTCSFRSPPPTQLKHQHSQIAIIINNTKFSVNDTTAAIDIILGGVNKHCCINCLDYC